jgi:hypothetical protein
MLIFKFIKGDIRGIGRHFLIVAVEQRITRATGIFCYIFAIFRNFRLLLAPSSMVFEVFKFDRLSVNIKP